MKEPKIENIREKKLIGMYMAMSIADNKTGELWRNFIPRKREFKNNMNQDLISMQIFESSFDFQHFDIHKYFVKWAAIEVNDFVAIPDGMQTYTLPAGMYAVFLYKGAASEGASTFRYIFETWIPQSGFEIDHRPHFEILGEKYKHEDPASEEEIWIPIRPTIK